MTDPTPTRRRRRGHLRDVATICPATMTLASGYVLSRCELDAGHGGKHKDGCTRWGAGAEGTPR